ncbi:MAG: hypothetical protein ACRDNH_13040 [Gaiellaceae bacterium]
MNPKEETRIARTESVFRHVNERIAEASDQLGSEHFIVADGHVEPKYERIVERRGGYAVVEKFKRRLAALVRRTDPRARAA